MSLHPKRPQRAPRQSTHAQSSSFVSSLLLVLLCILGMTSAGIVHHEPGEIQKSYNFFNLLNNYVVPPPTSNITRPQIVTDCPPNVIFVMDGSGSVSFAGFNTIKSAVIREIRALMTDFAQVDVGVVLFSEENLVIPIETRTPAQMQELIKTIQNLDHPRLGTELNEAIRVARRALAVHSTNAQRALNGDKSGNVLVLFTDGNVEPNIEKASAAEVQIAQSKGILVLVDTVEEPSRTVHNIAPTVLESRTPISWVDYVACPPATLNPPPKGSACRDFYLVVDGSDTVLQFEDIIRNYLAYTALRFRNVDNAIGINIYGTDTFVQARNTRIRMTEDKYKLADDIRQQLRFPRSRGAGTSHAVTQSIGFLNDDIRERPAGLVLIMNGPPLDIQATAQAIRQARQQGYPVVIIRIGPVSDAELQALSSGDMRGVYNIRFITDLFGVKFDDVICGGGACQLKPQSCAFPRTFHAASCSCVCGNSCAMGSTHGPNCQCQCEGQCPVGHKHDADCLCRCPNNCPQGTRQNNDCSCTACPFRCQNNQFQDPNCACQCRNRCPQNAELDPQCQCWCKFTKQFIKPNGVCVETKEYCPLSQAECGARLFDEKRCRCVVRCPMDSTPIGTEGCKCNNPSQTFDPTTNLCKCPITCPEGQILVPKTCECTCAARCPNGQYNMPGANCVCLCQGTNQPAVNGVCGRTIRCPPNSTPVGTSCRCTAQGFQYNPLDNTCAHICPPDAEPLRETCQCREGKKAYDGAANRCVCRTTCQPGQTQNPTTCVCSCPTQCPVGQYNSPQSNCQCRCTTTNQPPVGGRCLPIVRCPGDAIPSGNTCQCRLPVKRYDQNTNQCVCGQTCQPGQIQNPTTCSCSCPTQCPTGQYNSLQTGCRCLCTTTNQPPVGGRCLVCPPNALTVGTTCQCNSPNLQYNSVTNICVCGQTCQPGQIQNPTTCACSCPTRCPTGQYNNLQTNCQCLCTSTNRPPVGGRCLVCPSNARIEGSTCQCNDPNSQYNSVTNTCVRRCPNDATPSGNTCVCRNTNRRYDGNTNQCVCGQTCQPGQTQNPTTCACSCPTQCPSGQYNSLETSCRCLCTSTNRPPVGGRCLQCPTDATLIGNTCQCRDTTRRYDPTSNRCVCGQMCQPGQIQNPTTCACSCPTQCPTGQYNSLETSCRCLCTSTNRPPVGGRCLQCPTDATLIGNTCQCRDTTRRYDSTSNRCVCGLMCQPGQKQNPTTCACSCPTQCPTGQYNSLETSCRCLCTSTNRPPVGGRCLQCPTGATLIGNTCQCRDTTRRYDPTSNRCVCGLMCQPGQIQNPTTCACSCPTQCPTGQYNSLETSCRCLCTSTNRPPVGGRCLQCPTDATLIGNTCQCRDTTRRYDPTSNRCVCGQTCQPGQIQNPTTCACSCPTQCPTGQYNNAQTNCQCLCSSTNKPPVGGRCLLCPSNARPVGSTCQCTERNFLYNSVTNICARNCPSDSTPIRDTCQCTQGNKAYDQASNRCLCRQTCQPGQIQNPTTCACSCPVQCPTGQYSNQQTNCRCVCTSTNRTPVNGICLVCPSNARIAGSTCQCNDPNSRYNSVTNTCVVCPSNARPNGSTCQCTDRNFLYNSVTKTCARNCPSDSTPIRDTCQCTQGNKAYDQASNRCLCRQTCQPGQIQNPTTCACSCPVQCPTGQYSNQQTNCRCVCASTNRPAVNGICLVCPSNARIAGSTCQCNDPNSQYNSVTNTCVRRCPSDATPSGNTCVCKNMNKRYDPNSNQCVCRLPCQPGQVQNPTTCDCSCAANCPAGQYNQVRTNCQCLCRSTNQPPVSGRCLVCPSNARPVGSTCQCTSRNLQYNTLTNTCACRAQCGPGQVQNPTTCDCSCATNCPTGQYNQVRSNCQCLCRSTNQPPIGGTCLVCPSNARPAGSTCQCTSSNQQYNTLTNTCACRTQCGPGQVQNPSTCDCSCATNCPTGQYNQVRSNCQCLCRSTNQPPIGGTCLVCPSNARPAGSTCQCTSSNQQYNTLTNTCACRTQCGPGQVQNPSTCDCSCATNCPTGQYNQVRSNCQCLCRSTNQPPIGGTCLVCPSNARPAGSTCQCTSSNQQYNTLTNTCACRTQCGPGQVQNPSTCDCSCATNCPAGQYNQVRSNCQCLCRSTNRPPVGGRCLVCPSNAQPVGSTCQCTSRNLQYNTLTNTCACRTLCGPGQVQNPTTCDCSCATNCPTGQYNQVRSNCQCLCRSTNQPPVGGRCVICPSNARPVGSTCMCTDVNSQYDSVTNICVRRNRNGSNPSRNTTYLCSDTSRLYDASSKRCVCRSACQTGSIQNPTTCACSCPTQCPAGQYNNPGTNCRCLCATTNRPPVNGRCLRQCPPDAVPTGNTCKCNNLNRRFDSYTNRCVCSSICQAGAVQDPNTCSCRCQASCPVGQYSSQETGCRCLCVNTRQPPQGGVCLTCPPEATPAGTSCQCTDPCYTYNPITNTCVQNCPNDARLVGTTCQCTQKNKIYDRSTNQCLCRSGCPPGSVQTPLTCACSCPTRCPPGQYNSPERSCRCLCPLDNREPIGGDCSRIFHCTKTQADCPTGQFLNADPMICRCENQQRPQTSLPNQKYTPPVVTQQPLAPPPVLPQPPGRGRCPESEWQCANGRPAYRDCHGACVCECSSMFAGPRCEITVNASLCDNCHYFQGIYKAGIPGFCDLFVHCHPVTGVGKDNRGRPRAFTATVQRCAPGTYYVTRPDGYEGCDWLSAGTCFGDVCANLEPNAKYPDESACQRYWQCNANRKLSKRACCPTGQSFDPRTSQCVNNPTCPDVCGPCNTTNGGGPSGPRCPLAPVPGRPNQYYHLDSPGAMLNCPLSLVFDTSVCTCIAGQGSPGPQLCVPTFQTDFERPLLLEHTVPRISFQGSHVANFRGTDDLVIKAFAASGFHTNYFQIDLRVYLTQQPQTTNGQRVAVVTNADCNTIESVSITMDGTNFYFRIYQMGMKIPAEITIPYSGLQDPNGWYKLRLVYAGKKGNFQFMGTVGSRTVPYKGPVKLTSYIDRRKCALHLGFGFNYAGFKGYINDVSVWRCKP